ncbi:MAG: FHIPEP family type III secretion protein [Acidimicrobiaceae bacterium]|nr:FHIPEP family type III secretion protein [Acidimicrobiaceae bacterium]
MPKTSRLALAVPIGIAFIVVMLVVPLPTMLLDILISINIAFALVVLSMVLRVRDSLEFSAFPSVLLIATLFRLALNVSATRLVLLHGYAGSVIQSFGNFVVGGSVVVGLIVFLILFVIQFVVITNGAGRVAEVGARFTLDAMPGKQMAIDADLNAGHIDETEARARRQKISKEADFYGAMDGASKFVKGDAIAAVLITMINLIGGFLVGVVQRHLSLTQAIDTYSLLSVGDGLVSQIPALLLSISTGLIVTRASNESDFGTDLLSQLRRQNIAIRIAGGALMGLAVLPGLPKIPFILVGGVIFFLGRRLAEAEKRPKDEILEIQEPVVQLDSPETILPTMRVEPMELELSLDLLDVVDPASGGDLLDRVKALRRKVASELGILLPAVRTRDNLLLSQGEYVIKVYEVEAARGFIPPGRILAIGDRLDSIPGEATFEPVFRIPAKWVPIQFKNQAQVSGATVVDRASVITTHLSEVVKTHAGELLSRQSLKEMVDSLRQYQPVLVDEMAQAQLSLGELQRVLRDLLEEGLAVRDLPRIVEAVTDRAKYSRDADFLLEGAREAIGFAVAAKRAIDGKLFVLVLEPELEHLLVNSLQNIDQRGVLLLDPTTSYSIKGLVSEAKERASATSGVEPVLITTPRIRTALARMLRGLGENISVVSSLEIPAGLKVERIGVVDGGKTAEVYR